MVKWINKTHNYNDLFKSYDNKYGASSDFSQSQELIFADNEVKSNLRRALAGINLQTGHILDIGINNAFEIKAMKKMSGSINWNNVEITGVDLSESALNQAKNNLKGFNYKLILGNIMEFCGHDIVNNKLVKLQNNQFDACFAITSLQSSGIVNGGLNDFIKKLIKKMKQRSYFLIIVPNCYIENGQLKNGGAFDAEKGLPDKNFAPNFVDKVSLILKDNAYNVEVFGEKFIIIVAMKSFY